MRFLITTTLLLGVGKLTLAQSMPLCAVSIHSYQWPGFSFAEVVAQSECLGTYLPASSCSSTDFACICADTVLLANVSTCTLGSCTLKESLSGCLSSALPRKMVRKLIIAAAKNATSTLCGEPVRDITIITPIVCGTSMALAIVAVIMRLADSFARKTLLHWSNIAVVLGLVRVTQAQFNYLGALINTG